MFWLCPTPVVPRKNARTIPKGLTKLRTHLSICPISDPLRFENFGRAKDGLSQAADATCHELPRSLPGDPERVQIIGPEPGSQCEPVHATGRVPSGMWLELKMA